jgi:Domain of unknown function (DUF4402)
MRTSIKILLLLPIITLFATTGVSFAQTSANTNVTINATVIQGLTLSVSGGPLNFGTIVAGTTPASISAQSSSVLFTASGNGGSTVTVTYSNVTLSGPSGATLNFTSSVYGSSSSSGQSSSSNVPSSSTINLSGTTGSAGYYYLWLGGNLGSIPSNQTPGAYSGTFTMTVNY